MTNMDGPESKCDANGILEVSLGVCKAGAVKKGLPFCRHIDDLAGNPEAILPIPAFNMIDGGSHTGKAGKSFCSFLCRHPVSGKLCVLEQWLTTTWRITKEKYRKFVGRSFRNSLANQVKCGLKIPEATSCYFSLSWCHRGCSSLGQSFTFRSSRAVASWEVQSHAPPPGSCRKH